MRSQPEVIDAGTVEAIYSAARLRATWVSTGRRSAESLPRERRSTEGTFTSISLGAEPEATSPEERKIVVTYAPDTGLRLFGDPTAAPGCREVGRLSLEQPPAMLVPA